MEIYKIVNTKNGKRYVGQTRLTLEKRIDFYYLHYAYPEERPYPIERAMRKYGIENFVFETLHECHSQEALDYWERYYIEELDTKVPKGYNVQSGGRDGGWEYSREAVRERLILKRYRQLQRKKTQRAHWYSKWLARDPGILKPPEEQQIGGSL